MALVECQDATLLSIPRLFHNGGYRDYVLKTVTNPLVRAFWEEEFPTWTDRSLDARLDPVLNKIERVLMHPDVMCVGMLTELLDPEKTTAGEFLFIVGSATLMPFARLLVEREFPVIELVASHLLACRRFSYEQVLEIIERAG